MQNTSSEMQAQLGARDVIIQGLLRDKGLIEEQNRVSASLTSSSHGTGSHRGYGRGYDVSRRFRLLPASEAEVWPQWSARIFQPSFFPLSTHGESTSDGPPYF